MSNDCRNQYKKILFHITRATTSQVMFKLKPILFNIGTSLFIGRRHGYRNFVPWFLNISINLPPAVDLLIQSPCGYLASGKTGNLSFPLKISHWKSVQTPSDVTERPSDGSPTTFDFLSEIVTDIKWQSLKHSF